MATWGLAAAVALLWPARVVAALDGIPLDSRIEIVAIGLVLPALWWLHPEFLVSRLARSLTLALLLLKLTATAFLVQEGWCATFVTPAPLRAGGKPVQLSWDARADWRSSAPRCSAIVARPYPQLEFFPAWFLNLAGPAGRPPREVVAMTVDGYLSVPTAGTLDLGVRDGQEVIGSIDDHAIEGAAAAIAVAAGVHRVQFWTVMTGGKWQFTPQWNGSNTFASVLTTTHAPGLLDRLLWRTASVAVTALSLALLVAWAASAAAALRVPVPAWIWSVGATAAMSAAGLVDIRTKGRLAVLPLIGAIFVPLPVRLRDVRGIFLLIGIPWLALFAAGSLGDAGRFTLYSLGDDFTEFQRFAHRIYIDGYWLEGGQATFWFQPLYRWTVGALHIVFGDSSVGEWYLDAASLLAGALFAFVVAARVGSYRWGVAAAALTLTTTVVGPSWWVIARGLSEISAAGFIYVAALLLSSAGPHRAWRAVLASTLAVLSFYTRMNLLTMSAGLMALTLPLDVSADALWRPRTWLPKVRLADAVAIGVALAVALVLFAWRTWYYTGVFSVFFGTQRSWVAVVHPNDSIVSAMGHIIQSVLVVLTGQDPPRFDPRAIPILGGATIALLALLRVPLFREVPAGPVLFCCAGLAGAIVARGSAYVGRFSIHMMPITVALVVSCGAIAFRQFGRRRRIQEGTALGVTTRDQKIE